MKNENIFKKFLDSRSAWEYIQGPVYNRVIWDAAGDTIREIIDNTPLEKPNTKGLDVGSGPGYATIYAAQKYPGVSVIGVDYSPAQVKWARRALAKTPLPNCSFQVGDAMDLPFDDNTFDVVVSIASIKHWPDPVRGLREIARVLKPGCKAYIGEADRGCDPGDLDAFARAFTKKWWVNKTFVRWFLKSTVFGKSYTIEQAAAFAREAGFQNVTAEKIPNRPFFRMILSKSSN